MIKKILFLGIMTLLISCSNNDIQKEVSLTQRKELSIFLNLIKENLTTNNIEYIKLNSKDSLKNNHILTQIKNIDFSPFNIFMSKPVFLKKTNSASSLLGLNFNEETFYFKLYFVYDFYSKKWIINTIKEI